MVAWPAGKQAARTRAMPTDLELVSESFLQALDGQMGSLPMDRDVPIYLEGDVKNDANWIVEDVLGEVVRARGHRLLVRAPEGEKRRPLSDIASLARALCIFGKRSTLFAQRQGEGSVW